jgi:hypothetical protein
VSVPSIPQPFRARTEGPIGPVKLEGIPTDLSIHVGDPLPKVRVGIDALKIDPLKTDSHVSVDPLKTDSHVSVDPLQTDSRIKFDPIELAISKLPDIRTHLPANFSLNLCVLGFKVLSIRLCGEAQVVTEPYKPNPCEICESEGRVLGAEMT